MTAIPDDQLLLHAETLKGKVVLITGAGTGIGRQTAIAFAKHGAKVIIGDIDVPSAKHTIRECLIAGGTIGADAMVVKCNVTDWDDQVELFKAGYEKYGRIDYVVPNAGLGGAADGRPLAIAGYQKSAPAKPDTSVVEVNTVGVIYTVRLGQYYMMKNKSADPKAIVFIGSMSSLNALPKGEIYCATKHAIIGLCRSLHDEFKAYNIRVATVCPWFVDTPILKGATRVLVAGVPLTPIWRVASAVVNTATDPDWETSGATYTIPDENEVFRISGQELMVDYYKLLYDRLTSITRIQSTISHYQNVILDLLPFITPALNVVAFILPLLAYYWFFVRDGK